MSRSTDPSSAPVVVALVAIASVVLFIALTDAPEEGKPDTPAAPPAAADGPDPFADVELELPRAGRSFPSAPDGVADHPDNLRARELARQGIALVESAFEARDAGDEELFLERAASARVVRRRALPHGVRRDASIRPQVTDERKRQRSYERDEHDQPKDRRAHRPVPSAAGTSTPMSSQRSSPAAEVGAF